MTQYVGSSVTDVLNGFIKRYAYGLRRNEDGELFLIRLDQMQTSDDNVMVLMVMVMMIKTIYRKNAHVDMLPCLC